MKTGIHNGVKGLVIAAVAVMACATSVSAYTSESEQIQGKQVNYVTFHPTERLELKPVIASGGVGSVDPLYRMAQDHDAVAAINGTFFNSYDESDLHPMGAVVDTRAPLHMRGGPTSVGMVADGSLDFFPTGEVSITGSINGSWEWPNNWYAWFVNHQPSSDQEIVIFTPDYRSDTVEAAGFTFVTVTRGTVTAITRNRAAIPALGYVIAFGPEGNDEQIAKFKVGDDVAYRTNVPAAHEAVKHILSAGPKLVTDGQVDVDFERENIRDPNLTTIASSRSFIGEKADGTIVFGTVNRATIRELADVLRELGVVEGMNLDGGASTGLYYRGNYLTQPGRQLSNALVLVPEPRTPRIRVNDREVFFPDANPYIENGTTMIPVRGVLEQLGAVVTYDDATREVRAVEGDVEVVLPVGSDEGSINGEAHVLINPPVNLDGRVHIPIRFVSEAFGAEVGWDYDQYLVTIDTK